MTVDILSSIKGAEPSEAVNKLFEVIKHAQATNNTPFNNNHDSVSLDNLRADEIVESSALEKQIIKDNFPKEKNGYLVVSKVIDA